MRPIGRRVGQLSSLIPLFDVSRIALIEFLFLVRGSLAGASMLCSFGEDAAAGVSLAGLAEMIRDVQEQPQVCTSENLPQVWSS